MIFNIAVPNLNYGRFIGSCLSSIERQKRALVRVVIVDGGSTDNSLEIISDFAQRNRWSVLHLPGQGQAVSIKAGFEHLDIGDGQDDAVFCWLNSDDVFLREDALEIASSHFTSMPQVDILSLGGYYLDADGRLISPVVYDYNPAIRGNVFLRGGAFLQPATFWRRRVFLSISLSERLKYAFDGDFFLRAKKAGFDFYLDQNIRVAGYRIHGTNLSLGVPHRRVSELAHIYREVLDRPLAARYLLVLAFVLRALQRIPFVGRALKTGVRYTNNVISYVSRYLVPSI